MTRLECEKKLLDMAEQMQALYKEYMPAGERLSVSISDRIIMISDCFFAGDEIIEDANGRIFKTIDCAKYADGVKRFGTVYDREGVKHEALV